MMFRTIWKWLIASGVVLVLAGCGAVARKATVFVEPVYRADQAAFADPSVAAHDLLASVPPTPAPTQ